MVSVYLSFNPHLQADAPSVHEMSQSYLWGYLSTYTKFGQEPSCAGSIRVLMHGAVHVIVFEYSGLLKMLKPTPEESLLTKLQALTELELAKFKGKVDCWFAQADATDDPKILVIPQRSTCAFAALAGGLPGSANRFLDSETTATHRWLRSPAAWLLQILARVLKFSTTSCWLRRIPRTRRHHPRQERLARVRRQQSRRRQQKSNPPPQKPNRRSRFRQALGCCAPRSSRQRWAEGLLESEAGESGAITESEARESLTVPSLLLGRRIR